MDFSETIAACDLKVGRCRQLIEIMKVCEYWRSRSFLYHIFSRFCMFCALLGQDIRWALTGPLVLWFSSPEPKAHWWAYSIPMLWRPSSSTISNIFFFETAGPIKAKFYVEPPWVGGAIFCSQHLGHMTKMAATPIYGKNPSKVFFSRTGRPIFTKLGM